VERVFDHRVARTQAPRGSARRCFGGPRYREGSAEARSDGRANLYTRCHRSHSFGRSMIDATIGAASPGWLRGRSRSCRSVEDIRSRQLDRLGNRRSGTRSGYWSSRRAAPPCARAERACSNRPRSRCPRAAATGSTSTTFTFMPAIKPCALCSHGHRGTAFFFVAQDRHLVPAVHQLGQHPHVMTQAPLPRVTAGSPAAAS
jgi:hypothetical protein